jgi:protein associated with RNAse G/E
MGNFAEIKKTYFGETKIFDCNLVSYNYAKGELIISFVPDRPMTFVGVKFPVGSISYGYYWENRNYNVYHWKGANGDTLLFYFNISRDTRIENSCVTWLDLIVDIAIKPQSSPLILDEDEIPKEIAPTDFEIIEKTRQEILKGIDGIVEELESKTARFL